MPELAQQLILSPPRDTSGSRSANRFDYQADWALCHLLELHVEDRDYVILLDHHDDVVVLDSAMAPRFAVFYQVKTKDSGNWTRLSLTKRKQGETGPLASILGKLYRHYIDFPDAVQCLCFASNAPLSMDGQAGVEIRVAENVTFADLSTAEQAALKASIATEHSLADSVPGMALFAYKKSTLSHTSHVDQSMGRLATFLESIPEATMVPVPAFYRTLKGEITRAVNHEGTPSDFQELCTCKAITRSRFTNMIGAACALPTRADHVHTITTRLNSEGVPFSRVSEIERQVKALLVHRFDFTNDMLQSALKTVAESIAASAPQSRLWDTIENIRSQNKKLEQHFRVPYLQAMIGVLLYEQSELPDVDPNPTEASS